MAFPLYSIDQRKPLQPTQIMGGEESLPLHEKSAPLQPSFKTTPPAMHGYYDKCVPST